MKIGAIRAQAACAWVQAHVQVHVRARTGDAIFRIETTAFPDKKKNESRVLKGELNKF
jgi:hypothetical protein